MKIYLQIILLSFVGALLLTFAVSAQVAGNPPYTIEQSVIASGGGTSSSATGGSGFSITGTFGQAVAGTASTNSPFILRSGFFAPELFAPTAASVTIEGRVRMANGKGILNVRITLTEGNGTTRSTLSGFSGKYSFTDVAVGQTVIISATAKRFSFSQSTRVLSLSEETHGIDFIGIEL